MADKHGIVYSTITVSKKMGRDKNESLKSLDSIALISEKSPSRQEETIHDVVSIGSNPMSDSNVVSRNKLISPQR